MIDTIVQWLASLTASPLGQLAIFYVVSGLLSLVLARRSQLDAWAETHPRLAAVYKALRAVGIDPWMLVQALSLAVKGRLPSPPNDKPKGPPSAGRVAFGALALVGVPWLVAIALASCSSSPPSPAVTARDAYRAALTACELYRLAPDEHHTREADIACAELVDVCTEPASAAAANVGEESATPDPNTAGTASP